MQPPLEAILDLARWAPSGDNTQPWRFEIVAADQVVVHGFDTRKHCVYDLDGRASQLGLGCLLETVAIAATGHGLRMEATRRMEMPEEHPTFDLRFVHDPALTADALIPWITRRCVQRRPLRTRPLQAAEKLELERAVAPCYRVTWKEGWPGRWESARLMFLNAEIRLTAPEAFRVHSTIIEWDAQFSESMVPDRAVGLGPIILKLMRWAMRSWGRVDFLNRYLMGTLAPRLQLDLLPGLACAAHFQLLADKPPATIDDFVTAGRLVQRFWLTATRLGLQAQPEMTPVIFSRFVREGRRFTTSSKPAALAQHLARRFDDYCGGPDTAGRVVFVGRIGAGPSATARSLRLPLEKLWRR